MLIGVALAIVAGLGFGWAAAAQKREAVQVTVSLPKLLPTLVLRPAWMLATVVALGAWIAQIVAFTRAPIAVVMPFLALGTALLVFLGIRWLGERFGARELSAIAAITVGAVLTVAASSSERASAASLSPIEQIGLTAVAVGAALAITRARSGMAAAFAAGLAFVVTSLLSKEVGDRFAASGGGAVASLLASPTPWLLIVAAVAGATFEQRGFQRANAAAVSAMTSAVDTAGTVTLGLMLYHEHLPGGGRRAVVVVGLLVTLAGMLALGRPRSGSRSRPERGGDVP